MVAADTVLVTGANGFVGSALCRVLLRRGHEVRAATRNAPTHIDSEGENRIHYVAVGDINGNTDWSYALQAVNVVVHLAARVHVMKDTSNDTLQAYRATNTDGTVRLARAAATAGVARFIYMSTIKVNGEMSGDEMFRESDQPLPADSYAISKWEAECALHKISQETGMQVVILRPPLVYGPGVRANFRVLMRAVDRGVPLPLGSIHNRRSLVGVDNLIDFIEHCVRDSRASGQVFLVADDYAPSTPDLIRLLAVALKRRAALLPMPPRLLKFILRSIGKQDFYDRLCGSLVVDISKAKRVMDWKPPFLLEEGLVRTASWYRRHGSR